MITHYSFGCMEIDGKDYCSDLVIFPDGGVNRDWRRKEGHRLSTCDIAELMDESPELIIIGTGAYGRMIPSNHLLDTLKIRGIECMVESSVNAVKLYNEYCSVKRVGACFHLTC